MDIYLFWFDEHSDVLKKQNKNQPYQSYRFISVQCRSWYCFAVVTTIGFGDITVTTLIGKILTVILGLYGLVVVAVITSIVVNFYNETAGKKDKKELKDISEEDKKDK